MIHSQYKTFDLLRQTSEKNMGNFSIRIVVICLFVVTFASMSFQRPAKSWRKTSARSEQPNILFILLDDVGWNDVSYHGSEIRYVLNNLE